MKIIRCNNSLTAVLSGGRIIQTNNCTDEMFEKVKEYQAEDNEFELINFLVPEETEDGVDPARVIIFREKMEKSDILVFEDKSVYWKDVSPLSLPMSFAEKILDAEKKGKEDELSAYKNFWTLLSLNPDAVVRENLFKFLEKWGMVITKSGLVVGYRNADIYQKGDTPETTIYTDHHSGTTRIMIGHTVSLSRSKIDFDSSVECSRGLAV